MQSGTGMVLNMHILLDVLMCSIAEFFYELCCILTSPRDESKYKQRVKMLSDTTHQTCNSLFIIHLFAFYFLSLNVLKTLKILRAIVRNFQAFSTSRGHFISPIWLKFGM